MHMQLRKRKRVDYSGRNQTSDPPSTTTAAVPSIIVPKKRKVVAQNMVSPAIRATTTTLGTSNIIIPKPLQRPKFHNSASLSSPDDDPEKISVLEVQKNLSNLIKRQQRLFYKDIHKPTLAGLKNFEMLRLPNDLKLLQNIVNLLYSFEQLNSDSKTRPVTTSKLKASSQAHSDKLKKMLAERKPPFSHPSHSGTAYHNDIIHEIANLHSISLVDLINLEVYNNNCHTNNTALQTTANSLTLNSIIKKLDKPILKERNNSLVWPHKSRFKAKRNQPSPGQSLINNTDITLYNDV
ncbi:AGK_G0055580.mRNA.1.CDS.1 [Saccharomyces cerevisiae]|nr:unnamed protein product [Saccharomyces cerevisiae]CAI4836058.1 AGK_G0055580.mRNA.1.CDS.1 [Saccharomyces cerevisiae]CAI6911971.1 AGK_G0055580.mRNA.1.CDS.1 [Saccharomyces cerevisiae]